MFVPGKSRDIPGAGAETTGDTGADGAGVEPLIAGLAVPAQLGAELELILVPPRIVGGILPVLSSPVIVSVNNAVQEACCCNYLVSSFMYGMKQKNINKKAKITTITISATIPSKT